jgi:hypothetical protein
MRTDLGEWLEIDKTKKGPVERTGSKNKYRMD